MVLKFNSRSCRIGSPFYMENLKHPLAIGLKRRRYLANLYLRPNN